MNIDAEIAYLHELKREFLEKADAFFAGKCSLSELSDYAVVVRAQEAVVKALTRKRLTNGGVFATVLLRFKNASTTVSTPSECLFYARIMREWSIRKDDRTIC